MCISLERKTKFKGLDVLFNNGFTFELHIVSVSKTEFNSLGFLMRASRYFTDIELLKFLHHDYVLSNLE